VRGVFERLHLLLEVDLERLRQLEVLLQSRARLIAILKGRIPLLIVRFDKFENINKAGKTDTSNLMLKSKKLLRQKSYFLS
jgi:hypothetical protein